MATAGMIGGLVGWFGAKRTMAPVIVQALGPHTSFWEIFCGSLAVTLCKPKARTEVVNDLHGDLINLARTLQHPTLGPALYRRLRRVLCSEAEFRDARDAVRAEPMPDRAAMPDVDRAYRYFIASWQGMNGTAGTTTGSRSFARRFTSSGGDPATRWVAAVRSIPAWRRRLEGVTVLQTDGIELAGRIEDRESTCIYVDSPYFVKSSKYVHDFEPQDHVRLAEKLNRFRKTRVVISYYMAEQLIHLYPPDRWQYVEISVPKSMANGGNSGGKAAPANATEVLLINDAEAARNQEYPRKQGVFA